jgi:hypothetical protein
MEFRGMYNDALIDVLVAVKPMKRGVDSTLSHTDRLWIHGVIGFLEKLALGAGKVDREPSIWELDNALDRLDGVRQFRPVNPKNQLLIHLGKFVEATLQISMGRAPALRASTNSATKILAIELEQQLDRLLK